MFRSCPMKWGDGRSFMGFMATLLFWRRQCHQALLMGVIDPNNSVSCFGHAFLAPHARFSVRNSSGTFFNHPNSRTLTQNETETRDRNHILKHIKAGIAVSPNATYLHRHLAKDIN